LGKVWIKNAAWVVAWDEPGNRHVYLNDVDVVFDQNEIIHVGADYVPPQNDDATIVDSSRRMVMPGPINIHTHPTGEPLLRGLTEERNSRQFFMSTLSEYIQLVGRSTKTMTLEDARAAGIGPRMHHDDAGCSASAKLAIYGMLQSGVTTFVDYSPMRPGWLDEIKATGIRTCVAPSVRSATWYTPNGHEVRMGRPRRPRAVPLAQGPDRRAAAL
jgi:5-methylthioadenosine/S-adenosylhomocysteine deaminase